MARLVESASRWGNLYRRKHFINGKPVSQDTFERIYADLDLTPADGNLEPTRFGYRKVWEVGEIA